MSKGEGCGFVLKNARRGMNEVANFTLVTTTSTSLNFLIYVTDVVDRILV